MCALCTKKVKLSKKIKIMSSLEPGQAVPSALCFEIVEAVYSNSNSPTEDTSAAQNADSTATVFCLPSEETYTQLDFDLPLPLNDITEDDLQSNGLYYIKWMYFASHLSRAMEENRRKNLVGTGGMVMVACRKTAYSGVSSAVGCVPNWTFFEIERSLATTASLVLRDALEMATSDDSQPIYIENLSPYTMQRVLHYIKFGFIYGTLDKLEEFLEASRRLKIGAIWPNHYAFVCITCGPGDSSDATAKSIHSPWTNVVQVEEKFDLMEQINISAVPPQSKENFTIPVAVPSTEESSVSELSSISFETPDCPTFSPPYPQIPIPKPITNEEILLNSKSTLHGSTGTPKQKRATTDFSIAALLSDRKKSVSFCKSTDSESRKQKTNYMQSMIPECPRPKSAPIVQPLSTVKRSIKRRYRRPSRFSYSISTPQNCTFKRNNQPKRIETLAPPQQPKLSVEITRPVPPRPPRPRVTPQHRVSFAAPPSRRAVTKRAAPRSQKKYQSNCGPATTPITCASCYYKPQQNNWAGGFHGGNIQTQVGFNTVPTRKINPPQILMCQWCKLTFGSSFVLRLHQLFVHTNKDSLFSFPLGNMAAASKVNFDSCQNPFQK